MKKILEHVKTFAGLFSVKPNTRKNDQYYIDSETSLQTIADFFEEQQDRTTTDADHKPLEGMECVRRYIVNYLNGKVDDIDPKGKGELTGEDLLCKRVNTWFKPTEASATVASLTDKIAVMQGIIEANDDKESYAKDSEEYKKADKRKNELQAKLATM
mgnify:FL=1|tara:strand:- start:153 stop:626 length:474 start_codon:yes stop_codon:yes gene_type:complete